MQKTLVRAHPALLLLLAFLCAFPACSRDKHYPVLRPEGGEVRIDLSAVGEAAPAFYSIEMDGDRVDIFVVRTEGTVKVYLDACRECFPAKRGFEGSAGYVRCKSCNEIYPVEKLDSGLGSCAPVPVVAGSGSGTLHLPLAAVRDALSKLR